MITHILGLVIGPCRCREAIKSSSTFFLHVLFFHFIHIAGSACNISACILCILLEMYSTRCQHQRCLCVHSDATFLPAGFFFHFIHIAASACNISACILCILLEMYSTRCQYSISAAYVHTVTPPSMKRSNWVLSTNIELHH